MNNLFFIIWAVLMIIDIISLIKSDGTETMNLDDEIFDSYYELSQLEDYPDSSCFTEECAEMWLAKVDQIMSRNENRMANVYFNYATNVTKSNLLLLNKFRIAELQKKQQLKFNVKLFPWKSFQSENIKKIFNILTMSVKIVKSNVYKRIIEIGNEIEYIYNNGKPCYKFCLSKGESDIVKLFSEEHDYDNLIGFWISWQNETGSKIRNLFIEKMNLEIESAKENGINNLPSFNLFDDFQEKNFDEILMRLLENIFPLYKELHGYVRYCLVKSYPNKFNKNGPIPAHLFGDVWAAQWTNLFPLIQRCNKELKSYNLLKDINDNLSRFSIHEMFKMVESYFVSLGMYKMTDEFWERSVFVKPTDRLIDCHSLAEDFSNGFDYRVKMCNKKSLPHFSNIHHEMGHIQYYMAYRNLPIFYQNSANSAFQESIGDTIGLSSISPENLKRVGLLSYLPKNDNFDIDFLMLSALESVPVLPYAMINHIFISSIYNGSVSSSKMNSFWWDLVYKYQGIKPPVERTETDFDPGAKYHISFGIPYIRYFIGFLIKFQFHESLCERINYKGLLHNCNFYKKKSVGEILIKMMREGQRKTWKELMMIVTNSDKMKSDSFLKYYEPLYHWLLKRNQLLNISVGW